MKIRTIIAIVFAFALITVACGDDDGGTTGSDWIIDTNDNVTGDGANVTFGTTATLTATAINLVFDATGYYR